MKATGLLNKLVLQQQRGRLWTALASLCLGATLLFVSILIWWNFDQLLNGKTQESSSGSTFLTISKQVQTGGNAGSGFDNADVTGLQNAPEVQDVGNLISVQDKVFMKIQLGNGINFSTIMFLEAVPNRFMDEVPADWGWNPGNTRVPIILSAEFLNLYNYVFAPGQGLPQISRQTIHSIPFVLEVGSAGKEENYVAYVAGFSDRITSVLVPEDFAKYVNQRSGLVEGNPTRLVVKVADPSSEKFNAYLKKHNLVTNTEQLRWSKMRAIVNIVAIATGVLAVLLMGVSIIIFSLFIELTIARARQSVKLLLELGYKPSMLAKYLYKRFVPFLFFSLLLAVIIAFTTQTCAAIVGKQTGLSIAYFPGRPMWLSALVCLGILLLQMKRSVKQSLAKV